MSLSQRADDADLLCDIVRVTGLGRLYAVPARRTSRPQVVWSVASKLECRELARLLRRYPLRGRKRREFAVWSAAVDRWSESLHGSTRIPDGFMSSAAAELRASRRYVDPRDPSTAEDRVRALPGDGLSGFLGGFFSGEGSFSLRGRAAAGIHLRADDADLVRDFHDAFGVGRVNVSTPTGVTPTVRWTVCRRSELHEAIAMLDAAVLRGRKRREFEAWRIGAAEYARGRSRDEAVIAAAAESLARARAYTERPVVLPTRPADRGLHRRSARVRGRGSRRRAHLHRVRPRARESSRVADAEHPALAFGSWEQALGAGRIGRSRQLVAP